MTAVLCPEQLLTDPVTGPLDDVATTSSSDRGGLTPVAGGSRRYVRVPRDLVLHGRPLEIALYAVLQGRACGQPSVTVRQEDLMAALGRRRDAEPTAVRAAVRELARRGLVTVTRRHWRAPHTYVLATISGSYDVVPGVALEGLRDGSWSPRDIQAWCVVDQALGRRGWTAESYATLGRRIGVSAATMRQRVATFVRDLGLVVVARVGASSELRRADYDPRAWEVARPAEVVVSPPAETGMPRTDGGSEQGRSLRGTPSEIAGSPPQESQGLKDVTPECESPEDPRLARSAHRHLRDAGAPATSGRERPKTGGSAAINRADVQAVLRQIPASWRAGREDAGRYRHGFAARIGAALDEGWSVELLVTALSEFVDPDEWDHVIAAVDAAFRSLRVQAGQGLICGVCGSAAVVEPGRCAEHADPAGAWGRARSERLARQLLALGWPVASIERVDPVAGAWAREHPAGEAGEDVGPEPARVASRGRALVREATRRAREERLGDATEAGGPIPSAGPSGQGEAGDCLPARRRLGGLGRPRRLASGAASRAGRVGPRRLEAGGSRGTGRHRPGVDAALALASSQAAADACRRRRGRGRASRAARRVAGGVLPMARGP